MGDEIVDMLPLILEQIPIGCASEHLEIGSVVSVFCPGEASYQTGQSVYVDGGWAGKLPGSCASPGDTSVKQSNSDR